jgi:WD repeat-containing protein 35
MTKGILYQPENGKPSVDVSYEHCKLLYLISLYALPAKTAAEAENWIRDIPLKVIIFEGILSGILDLDFCPTMVTLSLEDKTKNVYLNISHESISMISELHISGLLSAIKMQSIAFITTVSYQLSLQGLEFLDLIPMNIKEAVNSFAFHIYKSSKRRGFSKSYLIQTMYDGECFMIWTQKGVVKQSKITEPEAVAFVGSPFLPLCLRFSTLTPLRSNSMRASECATGMKALKSKDFVVLSQVHVLVTEWIPFGQNQLFALIERTGAAERCKGGMFAAAAVTKTSPDSASLEMSPGLTQVSVLDYDYGKGINFQAHIEMPSSVDDIVQLEELGVHISVNGLCSYGMRIEALQDRLADAINIDQLARLLVHIQQDTSVLSNDLMSAFQRSLMERIFQGETLTRFKYTVLFCELSNLGSQNISAYIDNGDCEAELNQVLGPIYRSKNVNNMFQVLQGTNGLLVVGRGVRTFENIILQFVHAQIRMRFLEHLFVRTYRIMHDSIDIRNLVAECSKDPQNLETARNKFNELTTDLTTCEEVHQFLVLSTQTSEWVHDENLSKVHLDFVKALDTGHYRTIVEQRLADLKKLIDSTRVNIANLNESMRRAQHTQCMEAFLIMQRSTHGSAVSTASDRKYDAALNVTNTAVLVSFAFALLNRFVSLGESAYSAFAVVLFHIRRHLFLRRTSRSCGHQIEIKPGFVCRVCT